MRKPVLTLKNGYEEFEKPVTSCLVLFRSGMYACASNIFGGYFIADHHQ